VSFLQQCTLHRLSSKIKLKDFNCGNADLDEFLKNDALPFQKQLLGVTYVFTDDKSNNQVVCFFTISNDGLRVDTLYNSAKKKVNKSIPHPKHMRVYPAVKIGRLGVDEKYHSKGIGTDLMDFIKKWFTDGGNKTGCKFLLVDAYNDENVLKYYERNGFVYLMNPDREAEYYRKKEEELDTRIMFFDLMQLI